MKKLIFYGIILVLLFNVIEVSADFIKKEDGNGAEGVTLINGFEASGAKFLEYNVNSTLSLPNHFYTIEEMEKIKDQLIIELELKGEIKIPPANEYFDPYFLMEEFEERDVIFIHKNQEEGYNQITVTGINQEGEITVFIIYSAEVEKEKESHIIIDMVKNKGYKDIDVTLYKNEGILRKFGNKIVSTTTLVGTKPGRSTEVENKQWINGIIKALKANKVEEIIDESFTSITLFSREISKTIKYNNKKVNLQIATRYNHYEDQTYLWIATPLITNTY